MSRSSLKILLPILVLILGAGATAALISSRKTPQPVERAALGPLVEVLTVGAGDLDVEVAGNGEVVPSVRVTLAPQVTGRVVSTHRGLVSGGRFRAGAALLRIDPRDYELAVERGRAAVASATTALEREQAEAEASRLEWAELNGDEAPPALVARIPQVRAAEAAVASARADLASAALALERTTVSLPFDGLVLDESVDVGQLVSAGQVVATVIGTDAVEIRVPLDDRELAWLDVTPGQAGPDAAVHADFGGGHHTWPGRVDRLEAQVDPRSRMIHVVVRVDDPMRAREGRPALLPGTFVDVRIAGSTLKSVVSVPRHALRAGDTVWVVRDGRLEIRQVDIARRDREQAHLRDGVASGESVVVSALDAVTDGMTVRTATAASVNEERDDA